MATHVVDTGLTVAESRVAIESAMKSYGKRFPQYKPSYTWTTPTEGDFSFEYNGTKISGHIVVSDSRLEIRMGKLPFLLSMFENQAVKPVTDEINRWATAIKERRAKE